MITAAILGGLVVVAAGAQVASPWLKRQGWWPWRQNRKGGG